MLSSRCILSMKRLLVQEYNSLKIPTTLKASQETDLEVCQWSH